MRSIDVFFCLLLTTSLSACAIGPIMSHETARTVGRTNHDVLAGYGTGGLVVKWNYGVTENFDLGLQVETLSVGLRGKYAFVNQSAGWSVAGALGVGLSNDGDHHYGDALISYSAGQFEPYGTFRIGHVHGQQKNYRSKDNGQVTFRVDAHDYEYAQIILGSRYWFNPNWLVSLEATTFVNVSRRFHAESDVISSLALGYRF